MTQAAAQAAAFYIDVARTRAVFTINDEGGFPAPAGPDGTRAAPFWSTRKRAERIIANVPAYEGFQPVELSWQVFRDWWLPGLERDGLLVGVNWSGDRALGYDLEPEQLRRNVEAAIGALDGADQEPMQLLPSRFVLGDESGPPKWFEQAPNRERVLRSIAGLERRLDATEACLQAAAADRLRRQLSAQPSMNEERVYQQELADNGFALRRSVASESVLSPLEAAITRHDPARDGHQRAGGLFGMRNLLASIPEVRAFAQSELIQALVDPVLGPSANAVRGLYFDKTRTANWSLRWHQDKAIAVSARHEVPGYGPWSIKAGVPHVFPPAEVLAGMLTVRVHLDPCDGTAGALRVVPGSHLHGVVHDTACAPLAAEFGVAVCSVLRGDAVVMRPLLVHASERAHQPGHRRVIHLEYSAASLPTPLGWNECVPLHPPSS